MKQKAIPIGKNPGGMAFWISSYFYTVIHHSRVGGNLATKSNRNLSGKQKPLCRHSRAGGNLGRR
ncbi:TPA: hypothetical protein ACJJPX_001426, partial [Neisseria meningitidis]